LTGFAWGRASSGAQKMGWYARTLESGPHTATITNSCMAWWARPESSPVTSQSYNRGAGRTAWGRTRSGSVAGAATWKRTHTSGPHTAPIINSHSASWARSLFCPYPATLHATNHKVHITNQQHDQQEYIHGD